MGQHHWHEPPDDPQSRAFREATGDDHWDGDLDTLDAEAHEPITDVAQVRLPDDYEADTWDDGREPPKTPDEARQALAERIADPAAPDTEDQAGAYDEDGD